MPDKKYICIDLKSFYASVECVERGLDPLTTNLVVADQSRTEKTICLAVSPSLKSYGIPGRPRLFEVISTVKRRNRERLQLAPGKRFRARSYDHTALSADPSLELDYIVAEPQMAYYMKYSTDIYNIYLKHLAPEDIHVYSVDEIFADVTNYLKAAKCSAREFAMRMIRDVLASTGVTATAGVGSNMYLAKVAMDIVAKKMPPDSDGVRIAELDEMSYRRELWAHEPLTDFWRVGRGYAKRLAEMGIRTMGDIARCSIKSEEILYKAFGINAELLIDHAWGYEPCEISDIKSYRPETNSLSQGQVLQCPYTFEKARLIVKEMTDFLVLDLVDKHLVTDKVVLTVGYDIAGAENYEGEMTSDRYGRRLPKNAHGTENIARRSSSTKLITEAMLSLYDRIVDPKLMVRRIYVVAENVVFEGDASAPCSDGMGEQLDIFTDYDELKRQRDEENKALNTEKKLQNAVIGIKKKYGKNAVVKGMNLEEGATSMSRNRQIGGHKA